ncbi:MAG: dihydrodipicolinate synthase family protein [Prevotellaceae bacterium]|jgi:4-hydroxy-tetrahydrodipicolinate synthase|nr:dihydrodipicolinate synthase family protein [Prevotellaceae bacterium]
MNQPLKGIVPPLVTPMLNSTTIDVEGLERLINHIIGGGVHGLFVLGTTGEAQSLSYAMRRQMIELTCKFANGRVPVLVGITDTSMEESVTLAKFAAQNGASAVVSAHPYYYAAAQPEQIYFYQRLADQLPLPLFLYNMPSHTKVIFEPATVRKLAEHKNIIGLKDSSANGTYFQKLCYELRDVKDFTLLVGPEEMMAETVLLGGHGGVNGGANIFPKLYVDLYNAAVARDFEKINLLHEKVMQISKLIYGVGKYGSSYLKGVKCALSLKGICSGYLIEPYEEFKAPEREIIKKALETIGL